tara:strand:+ start:6188 stop:6472 length:285 start_codon:yes stop_codon:yes gene_type:complete
MCYKIQILSNEITGETSIIYYNLDNKQIKSEIIFGKDPYMEIIYFLLSNNIYYTCYKYESTIDGIDIYFSYMNDFQSFENNMLKTISKHKCTIL